MKKIRQKAILDLVRSQEIASQEELLEGLLARKIDVSQSTLSRDIQELGLAKSGGVYTIMGAEPPKNSDDSVWRKISSC
jgi:transcriptional regulator of arginine metabolism